MQKLLNRKTNAFEDATGKLASAAERTVEKEDALRESLFALFQEETRMQLGMEDTLQPVSSGETGKYLCGCFRGRCEIKTGKKN